MNNLWNCRVSDEPKIHPPQPAIALYEPQFGEPRVDSRMIACYLGIQHRNVLVTIERYLHRFKRFAPCSFQTRMVKRAQGGGHPERFVLLTEDQVYFLLSLSRNTEQVVNLKERLVIAFRDARSRKVIHDAYLPGYHELQNTVAALAQRAKDAGSQTDPHLFHMNFNKLVNKTAGIEAGMRDPLNPLQKLRVSNAQRVIWHAASKAEKAGKDHQAAYREAKRAATAFQSMADSLMGRGSS